MICFPIFVQGHVGNPAPPVDMRFLSSCISSYAKQSTIIGGRFFWIPGRPFGPQHLLSVQLTSLCCASDLLMASSSCLNCNGKGFETPGRDLTNLSRWAERDDSEPRMPWQELYDQSIKAKADAEECSKGLSKLLLRAHLTVCGESKKSLQTASQRGDELARELNARSEKRINVMLEKKQWRADLLARSSAVEAPPEMRPERWFPEETETAGDDIVQCDADAVNLISSDDDEAPCPLKLQAKQESPCHSEHAHIQLGNLELYCSEWDVGLTPLTEEDELLYKQGIGTPEHAVVAMHPITRDRLYGKDMWRLQPGEWLGDEVINMYLKLLQQRDTRLRSLAQADGIRFPKCHFFSSFFYCKLYSDTGSYNFSGVRRWTREARLRSMLQESRSILECDKVFVPIHKPSHWCMAVIDLTKRTLCYYDSLHGRDAKCLECLARYIEDEAKDKNGDVLDTSGWPRLFPSSIPRQRNGFDCGMFAVKFADYESRGCDFNFSQEHMPYFRKRMVCELMRMSVV
mmetsp:Transcript_34601/g.82067  ORF Transcript_34601/g.82067 Transcript_34601/m.82067 type:complete len:516 (-) Transcript_34601:165-1712(-)